MRKKLSAVSHQRSVNSNKLSEAGFTLTELLITMVVFVLAIAAASQIFTGLLTQFKQQSKIAETNIEGIIGLEILRQDLEHAGYGLPWSYSGAVPGYTEATSAPASSYNDTATTPPRAILSGNNTGTNGSDYLVIKAVNVARNDPSRKSTRLISTLPYVRTWTLPDGVTPDPNENPAGTDRVIVIRGGAGASLRELVTSGTFYTTYANVVNTPWRPSDATDNRIVYGINDNSASAPTMPFNRADYYIRPLAVGELQRCAPGTGVFEKVPVNHGGTLTNFLPLLDCVADMQVIYRRDTNDDGTIDNTTDDITALTAQQIREQVKEVRVYIIAHEGQRDTTYTSAAIIIVSDPDFGNIYAPAAGFAVPDRNYRWKVYTIVVKPENLRGE